MKSNYKIALVTGANCGIGFAVAKGLLQKGINVLIASRDEDDGDKALNKISKFGEAVYHQLDVTNSESIENCFAFAKAKFTRLNILIIQESTMTPCIKRLRQT